MQNSPFSRVVFLVFGLCCVLEANSFNKEKFALCTDLHDKDSIHILAKSDSFFVKGQFLYQKQEYTSAINYFMKSDSVIKAHYGTNSPYYGYGKMWASCCYHKLGMDSTARKYSNYYDKEPINKLLTHTSDSVIWIALKMLELGQIKDAAGKLLEAANLEKNELGPNNYWYANTLSNCAGLYSDIGDFEKAIELGKEAVGIYKNVFGIDHINYSTCLNNLAYCYADSGNAYIAIQLGKEAVEIKKKILGTEHPDYASDLSNLAECYSSIGDYSKALLIGEEALTIRRKVLGTEHPDYAISLICVASYYSAIGNYPKALELGTEAMNIWGKVYGTNHPYYATSLFRLSVYYSNLGNYTKAGQLAAQALEIRKRVLGIEDPHYCTSLGQLALYNSHLGNYKDAIRIGKEELELSEKIFGHGHPNYAISLANLANYHSNMGNYAEALLLDNKALEIWEKVFGKEHPEYAKILNNMAKLNAKLGKYAEAIHLGKQSNELVKSILGTEHPDYAHSLISLSSFYACMGNYAEAYSYMKLYFVSSQSYLLNRFVELSPYLRESMWIKRFASYYYHLLPSIVIKNKNKESISELYNKNCLFAKGILLNTDMEIRNLILESGDSSSIRKHKELFSNICIYNKLIETPIRKRQINADSLSNVIQREEMELAQKSKAFGDYAHNLTINWKDVQRKLDNNDIAVEFLDFHVYNSDSTMYVALTLKKGYDSPHLVKLFEKNQLKEIPESTYYTQTDVSDLIWKPLEEELKDVRNIYFAPSGELHRIGIEYLPINNSKIISDVYTLHRLSSTRQLAIIKDEPKGKNAILYGGIDYDYKANLISTDSSYTKESIYRNAFTYRTNVDSLSLRNSYDYLEGTKRETDKIAKDMKQHSMPYIYYCGSDGTEESFKKLNGTNPKLMHIATHGFYFTETEAKNKQFAYSEIELLTTEYQKQSMIVEYKPMARSGLLFSGCNHTIRHEQISDGEEDGILTAQEISTLDLRGLDLVVLSACQTGLGDIISGEGVFGLQRGFKKAGAKTIIMSLWNVNDDSTMKMMTSFYHHYLEGMPKEKAFHTAQNELRKNCPPQQERPDWAAFIMLDGLD